MDIKINAHNRYVEVINIDCDSAEDCTEVALSLWLATENPTSNTEEIGAGSTVLTEKSYQTAGFAYVSEGERLDVR